MSNAVQLRREECWNAAEHTHAPRGYREYSEWCERMSQTHEQRRCPGCDLWVIWVPKPEPLEGGGSK